MSTSSLCLFLAGCLSFAACTSIPDGAVPVKPFDVARYQGTWYEIARFDFRFERNLDNVTARYTLKKNGLIEVRNRGRDTTTGNWKESIGKARQRGDVADGRLKVSFFGPFYSGYNVIAIDTAYQYALIAGNSLDYLWILSRSPTIPSYIRDSYLSQAHAIGYDTGKLIWTRQTGATFTQE